MVPLARCGPARMAGGSDARVGAVGACLHPAGTLPTVGAAMLGPRAVHRPVATDAVRPAEPPIAAPWLCMGRWRPAGEARHAEFVGGGACLVDESAALGGREQEGAEVEARHREEGASVHTLAQCDGVA